MRLSNHARELFDRLRHTGSTTLAEAPDSGREPIVRRMDFPFDLDSVPRHWLGGSMVATALANALNLVFPDGERFFIRSVNHYITQIDDPRLRDRIKKFYGQEGQHAREHERLFQVLREQGFDIDAFLIPYRKLAYGVIAPNVPAKLRLSVTAALEHFTASFAEFALEDQLLREYAPAVMADLLLWHAAEEIEHKDVAYEVLQRVDDSYALRVAGLVVATIVLLGFWAQGIAVLLRQEPEFEWRAAVREYMQIRSRHAGLTSRMPKAFLQYLHPDFHPAKVDNDELALAYLQSIGRRYA
jgi:hypothetical protein